MTHEVERLDREIKRLERELETPIGTERRRAIQDAINHLKIKRRNWGMPKG